MIETERLILRQWKESDSEPFIKMGLDKDVMRFFPKLLSATESISLIQRISALIDENGWGFWAVELKETQEFIGFIGLHNQPNNLIFLPALKLDGELLQNTGKKVMQLKEQKQHWTMPLIFSIKIKWFLSQQQ